MPHAEHRTSQAPVDHALFRRRPFERPLYPFKLLGPDEIERPQEVVEIAGFAFGTVGGEWRMIDHVDLVHRETDD